jgi:ribosomal protein S27AE
MNNTQRDGNWRPTCGKCNFKMAKAGGGFSGRVKVQKYRCSRCGNPIQQKNPPDVVWPKEKV